MSYANSTIKPSTRKTDIITYLRYNLFDSSEEIEERRSKYDDETYFHLLNLNINKHLKSYGLNKKQIKGFITISRAVWGFPFSVKISEMFGDYELHLLNMQQKELLNQILDGAFNELNIVCDEGF